MDVYGIIYVLENTVNKKKYVGQTTRSFKERYAFGGKNNAERMYKYHKYHKEHNLSYNKHLLASFEKYGYKNFTVCERFDVAYTKEELDDKERYYIKKFNSFENGYNKTTGGTSDYELTDTVKILNYDIKNIDERLEIINLFLEKVEKYNYEIDSDLLEKISNYLYYENKSSVYVEEMNNKRRNDITDIFLNKYFKTPLYVISKKDDEINENIDDENIVEMIENYKALKMMVERRRGFNQGHIRQSIVDDIEVCNNYNKNRCNVIQSNNSKYYIHFIYDILNNDFEYNKENIKSVLRNWEYVAYESEKNTHKMIHDIKMDFENAFRKIKFTKKQKEVLEKMMIGKPITSDSGTVESIIEKIFLFFNKN